LQACEPLSNCSASALFTSLRRDFLLPESSTGVRVRAGIHFALAQGMDLYDVKGRGFASPLNSREISQLVRGGQFGLRLPCKPRDEATWRTIDELFPLLKYEAAARPLHFRDAGRSRKTGPVISACALIVALLGMTIFHLWIQSAPTAGRRSDQQPQTTGRVVARLAQTAPITSSRPARPLGEGPVIADQRRIR
jgi:hypothetical protein